MLAMYNDSNTAVHRVNPNRCSGMQYVTYYFDQLSVPTVN